MEFWGIAVWKFCSTKLIFLVVNMKGCNKYIDFRESEIYVVQYRNFSKAYNDEI